MRITRRWAVVGSCAAALATAGGIGGGLALAGGSGDGEGGVTGPGADRARAAALVAVPGGTATAIERDTEDGATWEVEVRQPKGATVDVRLGADYSVIAVEGDRETADGNDAGE